MQLPSFSLGALLTPINLVLLPQTNIVFYVLGSEGRIILFAFLLYISLFFSLVMASCLSVPVSRLFFYRPFLSCLAVLFFIRAAFYFYLYITFYASCRFCFLTISEYLEVLVLLFRAPG